LQDVAGSRTMPQNGDPLDHWMSCKGIYWWNVDRYSLLC
jgi:hypothetical protein